MKYIDIHSHFNFPDYDADREEAIGRAQKAGIGIITVGTDFESSHQAIALAEKHENMWATVGLHPVDAAEFDYEAFKKLALHPKVVAIGECGLDYFHTPFSADAQRAVFIQQIKLANEVKKPLMLHVRNAKNVKVGRAQTANSTNAYEEAVGILKKHAKVAANFHFFAGTMADLKNILAIGCSVSFTGVLTFTHDYDELVKTAPLDQIMSETDAPYASPVPYRGKRNESSYVVDIARKIAEIRGESEDIVLPALVNNAKKFFSI
jgi:TatD DNase family protein